MFSCEFCEIFKNIFFIEHLWVNASVSFAVYAVLKSHAGKMSVIYKIVKIIRIY